MKPFRKVPVVGLAIGAHEAVARVIGSAARPERFQFPTVDEASGEGVPGGPSTRLDASRLADALGALSADLERTHGRPLAGAELCVALLPPLVDARMIDLPPLKPGEAEAVVRRDAARHFLGGEGARIVGVRGDRPKAPGNDPSKTPPAFAAAAPAALLEALVEAAGEVEWTVRSIAPAQSAWLRAGLQKAPAGAADSDASGSGANSSEKVVVAVSDRTAHVMVAVDGAPVSLRRVGVERPDDVVDAVGRRGVAVLGDPVAADALVAAFEAAGVRVRRAWRDEDATAAAARFSEGAMPRLMPPTLAAALRERGRTQLLRMAGLAAALLVLAVGLHYFGLRRELSSVRQERAALRSDVAPLAAARDSLFRLNEEVLAIGEVAGRSHGWTRALAELSYLLPRETYLTALTGNEGILEFEAAGERAGEALEALRAASMLYDVRLVGTVERELENGETVVERFRLSARIEPPFQGEGP